MDGAEVMRSTTDYLILSQLSREEEPVKPMDLYWRIVERGGRISDPCFRSALYRLRADGLMLKHTPPNRTHGSYAISEEGIDELMSFVDILTD